ncbi:MAG: hypothetical protein ACLU30_10520 [Odoribacter splanchnicus]
MKYNILNQLKQTVVALTLIAGVSSCDYLDVIPDNLPTIDHAFQDRAAAEKSHFAIPVSPSGNGKTRPC